MGSRRTIVPHFVRACLGALLLLAVAAPVAAAGEYSVATCEADKANYSSRAFEPFATRGMKIRLACAPHGDGMRGMITSNVVRAGRVKPGALSQLSFTAPPGTVMTKLVWVGEKHRADKRYAVRLWAEVPGLQKGLSLVACRANVPCPREKRPVVRLLSVQQHVPKTFNLPGATRIIQRVKCVGRRGAPWCSSSGKNSVETLEATVAVSDVSPPTVSALNDTPLARGEWVGGNQPLNYDASDNVGVQKVDAIGGVPPHSVGSHTRACAFAAPDEKLFGDPIPCPNGPGQISIQTAQLPEGTQQVLLQAQETAGNLGSSAPIAVRIDNTPPGRVDVGVDGGNQWRNQNDFAVAWTNPAEADRAPVVAARYTLCSATCVSGEQVGPDLAGLKLQVPAPGEWRLVMRRVDSAGNESEAAASVPVTLRFDPEPPTLGFAASDPNDPTLVSVEVTDKVSGLSAGSIELSQAGSNVWQSLPTEQRGNRLVARVDDAALTPGAYLLRARAADMAGNEASTDRLLDGQPIAVQLPLRRTAALSAGVERTHRVVRVVRRHGKKHRARRRVTEQRSDVRARMGRQDTVVGQLIDGSGQPIAGAEVQVLATTAITAETPVSTIRTDELGRFRYGTIATMSRTLRFVFAGAPTILPASDAVRVGVPAVTTLQANKRHLLNGQAVAFSGRVRSLPLPPGNKLVEVQVLLSGRWQTFRTLRTDASGRWSARYQFRRTRGVVRYRFRARLPAEAGFPFEAGASRPIEVRVRGQA